MTNLLYSRNPGCVVGVSGYGGTPRQCGGREAAAVPHRYRFPRPHDARLYVCERHAHDFPTAEPLTDEDRADITWRRARQRAQLERAGRLDLLVPVDPH